MAQNASSKIHTATRAYLAAWAPPPKRLLRAVDVMYGSTSLKAPAGVGWVRDWWGKGDPTLNDECEVAPRYLENNVPRMLKEVEDRWPYSVADRALIAQFIALHVIRSDAGRDRVAQAREASLARLRASADESDFVDRVAAAVRTDRNMAQQLYRQVNKLASVVGSMHWTLLRFDEPWLITSDQPVCPVPLLHPGEHAQIDASGDKGWINTIEVRFPLGPRHALLATWAGPEHPEAMLSSTWQDAANLNAASRAQARRQWFHDPGSSPPLPSLIKREVDPAITPLSPVCLPGYNTTVAQWSLRRLSVLDTVDELIDAQEYTRMFIGVAQRIG